MDRSDDNAQIELNGQVDVKESENQTESVIDTSIGNEMLGEGEAEPMEDVEEPTEDVEEPMEEVDEMQLYDESNMKLAIQEAEASGGELGARSAYPNPTTGAVLVAEDGRVIGRGSSDYSRDAVRAVMEDAGLDVTPLQEWCVQWPSSSKLRKDLRKATLYLTMEPNCNRKGQALPPVTQLIELSGVQRVVIGSPDPTPELSSKGAAALHSAGIDVIMGSVLVEDCSKLIKLYSERVNDKLQRLARKHYKQFKKPLGFLHCSVVDSDNLEAFARHGNAFGKNFDGNNLSFREFGAYEIAPPPEVIWADDQTEDEDFETEVEDIFSLDFEDEDYQEGLGGSPMMPWYNQVDAVVATFPKPGNGPGDDDSMGARLNGLKWLATYGTQLPAGVERILVMDATDLEDLPMTNDHPNTPKGVDIESFWAGRDRKPTRVLLRRGQSAQAQAAANAAAEAAEKASLAAHAAMEAIETGDAESAAEAAIGCQQAAAAATEVVQRELMSALELKRKLTNLGTTVETLLGGEPIDVMKHLGVRNGYTSVVWRAGCWGNRGVQSILAGAFQWVSAHIAVDAAGGKFWQLMLAERAVQGACGPESKVKVFAGQEDISMEYCDEPEADSDCVMTVSGKPVRHVRLDCRVALMDPDRPREFVLQKTAKMNKKIIEEEAPWFI
eukprot:scaffold16363_cov131-Cylindrotheca_fusiformis.AAC.4